MKKYVVVCYSVHEKEIASHDFSKEDIEDNLSQMPDDVFDELVKEFGLPTDGVKL